MSIADKLATIAENEPKVYEAGKQDGEQVGKQAEWEYFWDTFQLNGKRVSYNDSFGMGWTQEIFRPKYDLKMNNAYAAFTNFSYDVPMNLKKALADAGVSLFFPNCINYSNLFRYSGVTEIGVLDFSTATRKNSNALFDQCTLLKSIDKIVLTNGQTSFSSWFASCTALENLTIEGTIGANGFNVQWSTKLTHDSLMSIINALEDKSADTSGTIWTVTIGSTNYEKLTGEEIAMAENKGWELI